MSLPVQESDTIKETIAGVFVSEISNKVELDQVMLTRIVVDYYRIGEKGPCGMLSLYVTPIVDKGGLRIVPIKYLEHLFSLLKSSESHKWKGFNAFRCYGISASYDNRLIFRIEFENLQHPDLPNYKRTFGMIRHKARTTSGVTGSHNSGL
jgi:hypothetical protein